MHLMQNRCSQILQAQRVGERVSERDPVRMVECCGWRGGGQKNHYTARGWKGCHKEFHYFSSGLEKVDCAYCNFFPHP